MSLLEKALKKIEESKKTQEEKKEIKIRDQKPRKKEKIITGDKDLNKDEICNYLTNLILTNKKIFPLDWLRGQKLSFDSLYEMRKEKKRGK